MQLLPRFLASLLSFLYLLLAVNASSLTTTIAPNEWVCFYADVGKLGKRSGFIMLSNLVPSISILTSKTPTKKSYWTASVRGKEIMSSTNTVGDSFCFENDMSTKLVDFDLMVESEPRREAPAKPGQIAEHTSALEESVFRLNWMLINIKRMQKHHHTRENHASSIGNPTQKYSNSFSLSFL
ncbi:hypothetical protein M413DRAFT_448490 [Hebeloma cylindrosporum]|uniref:GOLD domain-containing protein n=1 Tax=Hebeloma cylindrosporum TaxID=76867 RepID=A0A0C2XHU0_HEBCY|nr:hypothetical protein M413DRAFT_448490 [Hebeloma cylindrosporum h7]